MLPKLVFIKIRGKSALAQWPGGPYLSHVYAPPITGGGASLAHPFTAQAARAQLFIGLPTPVVAGADAIHFGYILSAFWGQASQSKNFILIDDGPPAFSPPFPVILEHDGRFICNIFEFQHCQRDPVAEHHHSPDKVS
jgi:hypothetical protein